MNNLNVSAISNEQNTNLHFKSNKTLKDDKKGLAKGAKIGIGVGLVALAAVGSILVKKSLDAKKIAKLLEEDKELLAKFPFETGCIKGKSLESRIKKVLGDNSSITAHSYDLSKEYPALSVYRDQGGYKDGLATIEGFKSFPFVTDAKIPSFLSASNAHHVSNNRLVNASEERLVSRIEILDDIKRKTSIRLNILSPNNKLTPAQKDLEKIKSDPKLVEEISELIKKATRWKNTYDKNGDLIFENCGKYEHLDYEVILSIIQHVANKAK